MKNKSSKLGNFCLGLVLALSLLAGCGAPVQRTAPPAAPAAPTPPASAPQTPAPTVQPVEEPAKVAPAPAVAFPLEITDQLGRVVTLKKLPQKIVSLAPSNTEILFALGLGYRMVGRTDYCDYPTEAKNLPSVGGYSKPTIEKVVAMDPDLILATSIHKDTVIPVLKELGFTVVSLDPKTVDEVLEAINLVGEITGQQVQATELVASLKSRIMAVTDKTAALSEAKKPRVFYVVWYDPLMSSGSGTFQADLIEKAGGVNVAASLEGWKAISLETVVMANPDVVIAGDMSAGGANYQFVVNEPRLANTGARKNNYIFTVNSDVASRPGPRIVDALEEFARYIHPELFK